MLCISESLGGKQGMHEICRTVEDIACGVSLRRGLLQHGKFTPVVRETWELGWGGG